ncbi:MAG: glycosyltransferase family 4 protein, partial [Candidatus Falkowbacteria bacterium]|nr:glycosyltransferase family 4 protein [Candidatus Falkowbacteria bacterium]
RDVDIFLLTPINITDNVEGFGLVYLEAAVFGKPAIGSWGSGAEDAIVDGQTGILVEPKKISNISDAVLKLAKDVNLRQEFGQNAQRRAMKYSWENMVKKYLDVYQQL